MKHGDEVGGLLVCDDLVEFGLESYEKSVGQTESRPPDGSLLHNLFLVAIHDVLQQSLGADNM